jgi:hypothetical protein
LDPQIHGAFFGNKFDPKNFVTWAAKIIDIPDQLKDLIIPEESMAPADLALLADIKA